ncbi:MAG: O-succinylhomoserine sulfhydrylase [Comamonadaceae bacterium]|nr:MAG: O-succinylhomoserine sulfhydrylase [Comamonadaceae bacterium]
MIKKQLPPGLHIDTLAVRAGIEPSQYGENSEALYLTSGFLQPDAQTAANRFAGSEEGFTYGRTSNPTVTAFENRLAALEGTQAAIGASSGMGAILMMGMGLLRSGDHVICSNSMFGSTINLFAKEFGKFGVETSFVSQTDAAQWRAAVRPSTKLLFAETPTNPLTDVCDIRALADIAHNAKALLAVDNCFCSPALQRPAELGADLIIHSGTKYLDGQGRVMAGAICGPSALIVDVFGPVVRTAGMVLAPFNAWVVQKGMETLRIRMEAQSANALEIARWLEAHPAVSRVYYPGLSSHPQHELAMRQQSGLGGAVLSFDVRGGDPATARASAFKVIDSTRVVSIATNLGDTKSIITHPATTSHGRLTEVQRQSAGIGQGLIRLAVGLEHTDDIKADLLRGLDALAT